MRKVFASMRRIICWQNRFMKWLPMDFYRVLVSLLLLGATPFAFGADVAYYGIFKYKSYQQVDASTNLLEQQDAYGFSVLLQPVKPFRSQVLDASIQMPDGSSLMLTQPEQYSPYGLFFATNSSSPQSISNAFPPGNYRISFSTDNDGNKSIPLLLPNDSYPAVAPVISNWTDAQSVDPTKPFVLRWNPIPGLTDQEFILVTVGEFRTAAYPGEPGYITLNATNTSLEIPAYSLPVETNAFLFAALSVERDVTVNRTDYPGALGYVGFGIQTLFSVGTVPPPLGGVVQTTLVQSNLQAVIRWPEGLGMVQLQKGGTLLPGALADFQPPTPFASAVDPDSGPVSYYRLRFLPPLISTQLNDATLAEEADLNLSVSTSGTEPIFYQWQQDGVDIYGGTGPTLLKRFVHSLDSGAYQVLVSNRAGTSTSRVANILVNAPSSPFAGVFTGKFAGQSDNGGFAVLVRADRSAIVVGYNTPANEGVFGEFNLSIGGRFSFLTLQGGRISGAFTNSTSSGTFVSSTGESGSFAGTKRPAAGIQQANVGHYRGTYSGALNGDADAVLAADGTLFFYVSDFTGDGGGFGTVDASNQLDAVTVEGTKIQGSLDPVAGSIEGTFGDGDEVLGSFSLLKLP